MMAVGAGFEPAIPLRVYLFSRQARSTTPASHRNYLLYLSNSFNLSLPLPDFKNFSSRNESVLEIKISQYINFKGNLYFVACTNPFLCWSILCLRLVVEPIYNFLSF